jgi:F-type H+-transporting ATPase subunit gamma
MKMVSAAKLRKAQDAIILLRPYANKLYEILATLNSDFAEDTNPFAIQREINNVLIIPVTSNRGLCGTFNMNILKGALQLAYEKYPGQLNNRSVKFMPVGKKGYDFLVRKNYQLHPENYSYLLHGPTFEKTATVVQMIMDAFKDKKYDRVDIVYNQFKNAAIQIPVVEQFLPFKQTQVKHERRVTRAIYPDFIFEPSKEHIIRELVPKSLKVNFYKVILDSLASEYGARMTAMHKATDNASELIRDLKLEYNKARQSSITNEILEIVSGADALKG